MNEGLKFYEPLEDSYSTYYFANPKIQKHMKHLEKVLQLFIQAVKK
jgi:hypothetical protein